MSANGRPSERLSSARGAEGEPAGPKVAGKAGNGETKLPAGPQPPAAAADGQAGNDTPSPSAAPKPAEAGKLAAPAAGRPPAEAGKPAVPAEVSKPAVPAEASKPAVPAEAGKPAVPMETSKPAAATAAQPGTAAVKDTPSRGVAAAPAAKPAAAAPAPRPAPPSKPVRRPVELPREQLAPEGETHAVLRADHRDPFGFLGMHATSADDAVIVRVFLPAAQAVTVIDAATGEAVAPLQRMVDEGLFAGAISGPWFPYRLRVRGELGETIVDDPYRFPPVLGEADVHLLAEGSHLKSYEKLGAHPTSMEGVAGVAFAVWAPHAGRVAVIGDFNDWDGRRHGMRLRHECGVWEIFIPGIEAGSFYKYEIKSDGRLIAKADPYAFRTERLPGAASIVYDLDHYAWGDAAWMARRRDFVPRENPIAVYEMHLSSWRRKPEEGHRGLTYQELADEVVGYVKDVGFTHVELMPISEFEAESSLGYQPLAPYAASGRWGEPNQLRLLIDRCHQAGIGVIVDWVPNHFADEPHGLREYDGTPLYEHPDARQRRLPGSSALVYDYGRREVSNYLVSNALFWLDKYHLDGLRVPSVERMLYLDYGRARGEWTPNRFGGHENLEAVEFLRRTNEQVYAQHPGVFTIAEEDSAWQRVSHPTFVGGLGFGFRWYRAWARDTLRYLSRNPVHRKYYHDELLRGPAGAFQENYILPLTHDDVAFGKGSLVRRMPGDRWQRFATLRALYVLMYAHPGKKHIFMGCEFGQEREWNSDISLDWHVLADPLHLGMQRLVRDLNAVYRSTPALYELDCEADGFAWIDCNDADQSVLSFLRHGKDGKGLVVFVCNFTPVVRPNYRVGVPVGGYYAERLNSDSGLYGGSNVGSEGGIEAQAEPMHGRPFSLPVKLPPFGAVIFEHKGARSHE